MIIKIESPDGYDCNPFFEGVVLSVSKSYQICNYKVFFWRYFYPRSPSLSPTGC
ncbi:hypothetical protein [Endozoicomonas sp. 4G]|uniref:hypothetical protein n=1 Tax=Endozoicomonas sp. 4G TaxID=2872754 RepID=UPI002078BE72|nr:hypothetical protein [Endozoicomonas sp. 4G]